MQAQNVIDVEGRRSGEAGSVDVDALKQQLDEAHKTMWALYKQLDDKNAALDRHNAELDQFATIASHDLQEPLRKVIGFARLLRDEHGAALAATGGDYVDRMEGACERMLELIADLLRLAQVTSQAQPFQPTDLGAVAAAAVSDLEDQIRRESGSVSIGELPVIDADPVQMRQMLQNLVSNALKFRHPDRPPVVSVKAADAADGRVEITVEDNGIGLKVRFAERIFQPFRRLHGKGRYAGTGMGLAIVGKIVERHGGEVRVEAEPDRGSRFIASLPRRHASPPRAARPDDADG